MTRLIVRVDITLSFGFPLAVCTVGGGQNSVYFGRMDASFEFRARELAYAVSGGFADFIIDKLDEQFPQVTWLPFFPT